MICLPWTAPTRPPDPAAACTVFAARLQLRSRRAYPTALRLGLRVHRALRAANGVVGHGLAADVRTRALWTVSAWADRTALARFGRSPAHRAAKDQLRDHLAPSTFAVWRCPVGELPIRWTEIRHRIHTVRTEYPS
jgi:heme-degrading monooxygenase HmoA